MIVYLVPTVHYILNHMTSDTPYIPTFGSMQYLGECRADTVQINALRIFGASLFGQVRLKQTKQDEALKP